MNHSFVHFLDVCPTHTHIVHTSQISIKTLQPLREPKAQKQSVNTKHTLQPSKDISHSILYLLHSLHLQLQPPVTRVPTKNATPYMTHFQTRKQRELDVLPRRMGLKLVRQ